MIMDDNLENPSDSEEFRHQRAKPPKEAYMYLPSDLEVIEFDEKNPTMTQRRIFEGGVEYNYYEKIRLKEFKKEILKYNKNPKKNEKLLFPPDWKDCNSLRFLQATEYNLTKTIEILINIFKWRKEHIRVNVTNRVKEILNLGFLYIHGRDCRFRPIINIIGNVYIKNKKRYSFKEWEAAVVYFLEYTMSNLLLPGQVENWVILCDLKEVSVSSFPEDLKKILILLQNNYCGRLFVMYLIGGWVSFSWNMVKTLVDPQTQRKIKLLKPTNLNEIFVYINKKQVEKKYGGSAPDIKSKFFPPVLPSDEYLLPKENKTKILLEEDIYRNIIRHNREMMPSPFLIYDEEDFEGNNNTNNHNMSNNLGEFCRRDPQLNSPVKSNFNHSTISSSYPYPIYEDRSLRQGEDFTLSLLPRSRLDSSEFTNLIEKERNSLVSGRRLTKNSISRNEKSLQMTFLNKSTYAIPLTLTNGIIITTATSSNNVCNISPCKLKTCNYTLNKGICLGNGHLTVNNKGILPSEKYQLSETNTNDESLKMVGRSKSNNIIHKENIHKESIENMNMLPQAEITPSKHAESSGNVSVDRSRFKITMDGSSHKVCCSDGRTPQKCVIF